MKSDNIIGAGDPVAVRDQQNMTERDRSAIPANRASTMIKTREEMVKEHLFKTCPHDDYKYSQECKLCLTDLLARRDEMVVEFVAERLDYNEGSSWEADFVRALKGKLR
jgi:hypothetical protein